MAIKTFTTGEVLTASDTNTYLANSGLVYVGQVTATSPATTITVNNVFSATYNAYRVVVSGGTSTGLVTASMQLLDSGGTPNTGNYYEAFMYSTFATNNSYGAANTNNGSNFLRAAAAISASDCLSGTFDLINPFAAKLTTYHGAMNAAGGNGGISIGYHNVASSFTGFRLTVPANAVSGTVVTVYGYRLG
jgi:hypothetical protein